jgi:uncharacterized protein YbjT (DUF2867 family)
VIALTGATGFVGGRLLRRLQEEGREVRCLTRRPDVLEGCDAVRADVLEPETLAPALEGVEVAYYLVHAIGDADAFAETEADGARNFAAAAEQAGVRRIVYLGGLARGDDLSDHMRSRQEVGRLLAGTGVEVIEFRASIVIGAGSFSYELIRKLVGRSPVVALPSWADARSQPIALEDVVEYLVRAADAEVGGGVFEIGGADTLSYRDLVSAYGEEAGQARLQIRIPLPDPIVASSDLPALLTSLIPEQGRAASKLVESLRFESTVADGNAAGVFGVAPVGVREALRTALRDAA